MAKTALIQKANRKPKFAVRAYTRCQRCGRPHSVYRKFGLCRNQEQLVNLYVVGPRGNHDEEGRQAH